MVSLAYIGVGGPIASVGRRGLAPRLLRYACQFTSIVLLAYPFHAPFLHGREQQLSPDNKDTVIMGRLLFTPMDAAVITFERQHRDMTSAARAFCFVRKSNHYTDRPTDWYFCYQ